MPSSIVPDDNSGFQRRQTVRTPHSLIPPIVANSYKRRVVLPNTEDLLAESKHMFNGQKEHAMVHNEVSFEDICERYCDQLYRFAVLRIGDVHLAQDIMQETLLAASNHWSELKYWQEKQLWKWLSVTASNKINDYFRYQKRRPLHWSSYKEATIIELYVSDNDLETNEALWLTLGRLTERERLCLLYAYWEGYTTQEIAYTLDIRESSVRSHIARGRKKFRKIYKSMLAEQPDGRSTK